MKEQLVKFLLENLLDELRLRTKDKQSRNIIYKIGYLLEVEKTQITK